MKITDEQKEKYLAGLGNHCPFCEGGDIVGDNALFDSGYVSQMMFCNDCSGSWEDVYTLTDVVEVRE